MVKNNYKDKTDNQKENRLMYIIEDDKKLSPEKKKEWKSMAELFSLDFKGNLNLSSLELDEKYACGIDEWKEFISYPSIKKYITSFRDEQMLTQVDNLLSAGKGGASALKFKEAIHGGKEDNSRLILFRLPEKVEVFEGEFEHGHTR